MSETPSPSELGGLSRVIDDLFSGRDPQPIDLPPRAYPLPPEPEPASESEDEPEPATEQQPAGGLEHGVEPSTDAESAPAGPQAAQAPGPAPAEDEPDPQVPVSPPDEERRGGTALRRALAAFVSASEIERPAMASAVRREAEWLRESRDQPALADAVVRLVEARGDDAGALALASEMVDPGVAGLLTGRLLRVARDDARREGLVAVLGSLGGEMVRSVTDALTMTEDRAERRALVEALAALTPANRGTIVGLVGDPRWSVAASAVQVIAEMADGAAVQDLTAALAHDHPRVREEALAALTRIGGQDAALLALGKIEDSSAQVRASAAAALAQLRPERALRPLLARLEEEEAPEVVVQILRALGALGDPGAVPALERRAVAGFFSREPTEVRVAAYRALGDIATPHARKLIEAATDDREADVRGVTRYMMRQFEGGARRVDE